MKKIKVFLRKNSSTILTIVGSLGVIGTSILAVKATPKAMKLIEEAKENNYGEDLTKIEIVKVAWKPYIPSFISGISTISCIIGSNCINKNYQKSLISAYTVLNNSYIRYKEHAKQLCGDSLDNDISKDIAKSQEIDDDLINQENDGKELFFDCQSMRYFRSTITDVREVERIFNEHLCTDGCASLNELYELLGLEPVKYGYQLGWSTYWNDNVYGHSGVEFKLDSAEVDYGLDCWIINLSCQPTADFIY